jgi:hypothetical protein
LILSAFPAYFLEIADLGKRLILRLGEEAFGGSMQLGQLVTQELDARGRGQLWVRRTLA